MIVNPSSGMQNSKRDLKIVYNGLKKHHAVSLYYTEKEHDAKFHAMDAIKKDKDLIIVCGGDGTVNEVACAVGELNKSIPIAVYPSGTSNDLANYLEISKRPRKFLKMIEEFKTRDIDLGEINGKYFINVAAMGKVADIADSTDDDRKAKIGFLAYFFEAISKLPDIVRKPSKLKITNKNMVYDVEAIVVLISNTTRAGGFNDITPKANPSDGLFDVLIIKSTDLGDLAELLLRVLTTRHLSDENVLYFQTDELTIEGYEEDLLVNLDGDNIVTDQPIKINIHKNLFKVLTN